MAQLLLHRPLAGAERGPRVPTAGSATDPAAAARGILLALALSCIVWVALALAVPLLW